jgi:replication-associated recombination protein RarA
MLDSSTYDRFSPKSIEEIVGNSDVWKQLATLIQSESAPHVLLNGPHGIGKSLFLKLVFGNTRPILKIDCTANSGLRDNRDSIRGFAKGGKTATGQFRWVILEHSDCLNADTQAFLRRMLETTSAHTRFLFEVNETSAISEPILSRTTLFNVNVPEHTEIVYEVLRRTDFKLDKEVIENIISECGYNLRSILLHSLVSYNIPSMKVDHGLKIVKELIEKRPDHHTSDDIKYGTEIMKWSIESEMICRNNGIDLRLLLIQSWPNSSIISNILSDWSRLGGTSCRAFFFAACGKIITSS